MIKHENLEDTQLDNRVYHHLYLKYLSTYATNVNLEPTLLGRLVNELWDVVGREAQKGNMAMEIFRG